MNPKDKVTRIPSIDGNAKKLALKVFDKKALMPDIQLVKRRDNTFKALSSIQYIKHLQEINNAFEMISTLNINNNTLSLTVYKIMQKYKKEIKMFQTNAGVLWVIFQKIKDGENVGLIFIY